MPAPARSVLLVTLVRLDAWRSANALTLAGLYFIGYLAVTALSLPVATPITLGAGALFGFWPGLVIVAFASSIWARLTACPEFWRPRSSFPLPFSAFSLGLHV